MEFVLGCIYLVVTGAVIFSMAVLLLQGEKNKANKMYLICHACVCVWCSSQIFVMLSKTDLQLLISYLYGNLGICFAGAFWILFSANYSNGRINVNKNSNNRIFALPVILSAIQYVAILTNHFHNKYYCEFGMSNIAHGPLFYVNVMQTYIFIIIGTILLIKNVKNQNEKKSGSMLIVAAVIIPVILSIINILNIVNTTFDITPLGFAISVILVRAATIRYEFFDMKKELDIASEKLILEKERNRIAQEVHDTTGHTLTMLQSYMKLTEVEVKNGNGESALEYVKEARSLTSKGIKELRESINQLREGDQDLLVTQSIMQLAQNVKEIPCEVTVQGEDCKEYAYLSKIIHDTVRECITNTLKYANAGRIDIVIRFKKDVIEVMIADDGDGCSEIKGNNGLRGINERVESAGGKVKYISAAGEGFMTRVTLPI